jgi:phytol kinase
MDIFINALLHALFTALYFGGVGIIAILFRYVLKIKGEWYRKALHFFFMGSIFFWLYVFSYWYTSVIVLITFLIFALIGLTILEKYSFYHDLLAERFKGEVKRSLTIAFLVFITAICVFWGIYGESYKYIILAGILAWGIGDALAALVGKKENNKVIEHKLVKNKKTVEGSIAMFIGSTLVIFLVLLFVGEKQWLYSLLVALIAGVIGTFVELYTKDGWDTLTLPPVIMLITYLASLY